MSNRIYVGNLSFQSTADTLRNAFSAFGEVTDVFVASDRETGQSRGFGFVTMATSAEAAKAISEMNGALVDGRALRVNEAEERQQRSGGGGGGGGGRGFGGGGGGGGGGGRDRWLSACADAAFSIVSQRFLLEGGVPVDLHGLRQHLAFFHFSSRLPSARQRQTTAARGAQSAVR